MATPMGIAWAEVINDFPHRKECRVIGSSYYAGRTDRDIDVLILVDRFPCGVGSLGWKWIESEPEWESYKKTVGGIEINALFVTSLDYFDKWVTSTEVIKQCFDAGHELSKETVCNITDLVLREA